MTKPGPVIVIFGITGDLSKRYLLPALYHLLRHNGLPDDTRVIGISRRQLDPEQLLKTVELCVLGADRVCDAEGLGRFERALLTHKLDPAEAADFAALKELLDGLDNHGERTRLLYMSVPARAYGPIVRQCGAIGLPDKRTRLLLEKPFGNSLASARKLIDLVGQAFKEEQVYRIDHYLAKEGTQNLLGFRFHNPAFQDLWNGEHITGVMVRATETIGIENRANFYEQTGALRDVVQNHLMQLLAVALMKVPDVTNSASIHGAKQAFLEDLLPADPRGAIRGQYIGYKEEAGNDTSTTETYARLVLTSQAEQWQGTPFVLETGKGLGERVAEVVIDFKTPGNGSGERLIFAIQPNEGTCFETGPAASAFKQAAASADLDFKYKDVSRRGPRRLDAYERVLLDAIYGDQSLFASDEEVLESWRVLQPILDAWRNTAEGLSLYPAGSNGPAS